MNESSVAGESGGGAPNVLDRLDPETSRHPQVLYRALREVAPALPVDGVGVLVVGGEEVDAVLRKPDVFSSADAMHLGNVRPLIPLEIDPPEHRKFRRLLDPLFAPQRMKLLEPSIEALVNDLIDGFDGSDQIDFAKQFSLPFPSQVFLTMLGIPLDELPTMLAMKDGIIRPHYIVDKPIDHPDTRAHQAATARSIYEFFDGVLAEREQSPQEDLLTWFLQAEIEGDRLTHEDILDICFLFLIAGLDTVSASLDCFFSHLAEHPELREQIVVDSTVIPALVEELLRWETPVMAVARVATVDAEIAGCPVAAGQNVMVMLGSANTDESQNSDAGAVRLDRESNRHLAFGGGIHRCLGSHLARLELRVALRIWHERIPNYELAPGAALNFTNGVRAVDAFPMVIHPAA